MVKSKTITPKIKKEIALIIKTLENKKDLLALIDDCEKKAFQYLSDGYKIPGYGLIEKLGNRAWTKGVTIAKLRKVFGKIITKSSDYEEIKMKSVAQLEKYFIELPEEKEKLKKFTERTTKQILAKVIS